MNIQELGTLADENLNVKIVLMNNNSLGLVYQQQQLFYGKRTYASKYARQTDFLKIAEGFGIRAVDLICRRIRARCSPRRSTRRVRASSTRPSTARSSSIRWLHQVPPTLK